MARSYGSIAVGGLLGSVIGGAKAAYDYSVEEQKEESQRIREERLAKLRMQDYQARADIDLSMMPKKMEIETKGAVERQEALTPGLLERRRGEADIDLENMETKERTKKGIEAEYADQDAEREGKKVRARAQAEEPYKAADDKRRGDEQIRVARASAEEARRNNWRIDSEGYYVDGEGDRVTRSERIEGRTVSVPVKAPESKVSGKDWKLQEELDSINRRIETAERTNADEATMQRLLDEKDRLLGRTKLRAPSVSTSNRPPLSSFGR